MNKTLQTLQERGFIAQCTNLDALSAHMNKGPINLYLGIDPTYHSLHIGHLTPVFMMAHFFEGGHHIVPLMGGGTARIGDPSGKTEMRKMLSYQTINNNVEAIKKQLGGLINFNDSRVHLENNADWLANLNYIDFLRDIGSCFSVNKMLSFEAYKKRMETGLSFVEFNYQLLQSYDYYMLNQKYGTCLQLGGDDQWGNITAGIDLIRRKNFLSNTTKADEEQIGGPVFGLTCPLITRSDGAKMGKSEKGAIFLDPSLTTPHEMFQYWRNVDDADVKRFLLLYTLLPIDEINDLTSVSGSALNQAKERLAYEYARMIHGTQEAEKAKEAGRALFGGGTNLETVPSGSYPLFELEKGVKMVDLFTLSGLCLSKSEARRLIEQGGAKLNGQKIDQVDFVATVANLTNNTLLLQAGKKKFFRFVVKN